MNYNKLLILILIFICGCDPYVVTKDPKKIIYKKNFTSRGFALVYDKTLYNSKIISEKIDNRSLVIFQKNLEENTTVRIKNILNNKSIIVKVGIDSNYPSFNNSVISERVAKEIGLDKLEPYVKIFEILGNSSFVANKAKTYDEEKKVANKAPIEKVSINNLNKLSVKKNNNITTNIKKKKFSYNIKIADFYFKDSALSMIQKIKSITSAKKIKIIKLSEKKYRVFLGPFNNINSLQSTFNAISILDFENIEIVKND